MRPDQPVGWMTLHPSTKAQTAMVEEHSVFHPTLLIERIAGEWTAMRHNQTRTSSGTFHSDSRIASGLRGMHV